jgi:hypothetical protein
MKGKTNWMVDLKIWRVMRENWGWEKKIWEKKEEKKAIGAKPEVRLPRVLPRDRGAVKTLWMPPWKPLFNHQMLPHLPTKLHENYPRTDVCDARVIHFFINIYVFNMMRFPLTQLDYNEKTMTKIWKKLLSGLRIFIFKNYF